MRLFVCKRLKQRRAAGSRPEHPLRINRLPGFESPGSVNQCRLAKVFGEAHFQDATDMLKLRSIGINDYSVLESEQRIGRIRLADERIPPVWLWNVTIHLTGGLPMGSAKDLDTAKADFKVAWEALKAKTPKDELAAAYKAMNIRDDG